MAKLIVECEEEGFDVSPLEQYAAADIDSDAPLAAELVFCGGEDIRALNAKERGKDAVTDVLSFPLEEFEKGVPEGYRPVISPLPLGDIVLCPARAVEQAGQYGHSVVREMAFLSVHSMLHLLGYDHMTQQDEKIMFERQEKILQEMSITRDGGLAAQGKEGAGQQ